MRQTNAPHHRRGLVVTDGEASERLTRTRMIGWALLMFGIGLLRKERGDYAALRRYGVLVSADVLELAPRVAQEAQDYLNVPATLSCCRI